MATEEEELLDKMIAESPSEKHGGARPGSGRPKSAAKAPAKAPAKPVPSKPVKPAYEATEEDYEGLSRVVGLATSLLEFELAKKYPNFPMDDNWRQSRSKPIDRLIKKHGSAAAKYSAEIEVGLSWTLSIMAARIPAGSKIVVDMGRILNNGQPKPNPVPVE